jgi:hypothetical protein
MANNEIFLIAKRKPNKQTHQARTTGLPPTPQGEPQGQQGKKEKRKKHLTWEFLLDL